MSPIRRLSALAVVPLTLLTLGAVAPPAASAPVPESALGWIEQELVTNGSRLPSSFDPTSPDWGLTLDAVLALVTGGRGGVTAATATLTNFTAHVSDYITGEAFGDTGSTYAGPAGKALLTVTLAGGDVHAVGGIDLEARARAQLVSGGLFDGRFHDTSTFGDFSNGFGQALNILALSHSATGVPAAASAFLLAQRCPAGGFRLIYDATVPAPSTRGCASDAEADTDATSLAISALEALPASTEVSDATKRAADWLVTHQDASSGGFQGTGPTATPNANSTGLATQALRSLGRTDVVDKGVAYLTSLQLDVRATGTPAAVDVGAIARDGAALSTALASGVANNARDAWRRATTQGVLGLLPGSLGEVRADVAGVTPARLLDTRAGTSTIDGAQIGAGAVTSGTTITLPVAGRGGVPADASAVVLNVTSANATDSGFVTVYPCDTTLPLASNVNFTSGTITANAVVSKLSPTGTVCLYVKGATTDLITDVTGWFPAASGFDGVTPARLLDTRAGTSTIDGAQIGAGAVTSGTTITLPVAGRGGVPADASAVVLNVTSANATDSGFVTVYPCDTTLPLASNVNFTSGTITANAVVSKLSPTGTVCLYVKGATTDLITDVSAVFG